MAGNRHGFTIGIERIDDNFFLSLKATGKLTHADYEQINPVIDSALAGVRAPRIKVFFDASELEGWELRAAWDDLKLGVEYGSEFEKVAIYGNKKWLELSSKISAWFIAGEIKFFYDAEAALNWLHA